MQGIATMPSIAAMPSRVSRRLTGGRFIAGFLACAVMFGGAAALADAGRLGQTHIVKAPRAPLGPTPVVSMIAPE